MSDLWVATGIERVVACKGCGQPATQQQHIGEFTGQEYWRTKSHTAPCALPCHGAAVPPQAYRNKRFHRSNEECPICSMPTGDHDHGR